MAQELEAKSVLVLYTGGTIGMKNMGKKGLAPAAAQEFKDFLWKRWQYLNVPDVENRVENGASLLMKWPLTEEKIILSIWILCYDPLMDSSNMAYKDWMKIANDIKENYQRFDGFVVLHGTDTMAYTASALSFIFTNLIKSVVLTGSQIPIFNIGSDAANNFEKAVLVAGTLKIPEVTLCFNNKLFRGNRTRKMNTTDFDAFDSPNFPPLAVFSGQRRLSGAVNWNLVLKPVLTRGTGKELILCTNNNTATENVNVLYIYPGITENAMNFVPSALILRSFGAGNVPDIVLQTLKTWKNSVLVVNISQCEGGSVSSTYAIGTELEGIGVVNGGDMTFEAAYTKLYIACILKAEISDRKKYFEEISKGEKTTPSLRVQVLDLVHMYRLAAKSKA